MYSVVRRCGLVVVCFSLMFGVWSSADVLVLGQNIALKSWPRPSRITSITTAGKKRGVGRKSCTHILPRLGSNIRVGIMLVRYALVPACLGLWMPTKVGGRGGQPRFAGSFSDRRKGIYFSHLNFSAVFLPPDGVGDEFQEGQELHKPLMAGSYDTTRESSSHEIRREPPVHR
ncbi:unnamed protein product [Sphacelaria rigidula]